MSGPGTYAPPSAVEGLERRFRRDERGGASATAPALRIPDYGSFEEFLRRAARAKQPGGGFAPYGFDGRKPLLHVVREIDAAIADGASPDMTLAIAGGAQFGKTILSLWLLAYLIGVRFRSVGYFLPDDDLVGGVVDGKWRPEVLDQLPFLAEITRTGALLTESGKLANRKGALMTTDGARTAGAMVRGMGKIPTTFSFDVCIRDEEDDIDQKNAAYVDGRMTSSDLRLQIVIGTQRVAGAGMNRLWAEGTQGVFALPVAGSRQARSIVPEEHFPGVIRLAVAANGRPRRSDPKFGLDGIFRDGRGREHATGDGSVYYLADPESGRPLERDEPEPLERMPQRRAAKMVSWRISQLSVAAIPLEQIVNRYRRAIRATENRRSKIEAFYCDCLANPQSAAQKIGPEVIARSRALPWARRLEMRRKGSERLVFAGVDAGERCWFLAKEVRADGAPEKGVAWAEEIPLPHLERRVLVLAQLLSVDVLCIDANPAREEARRIVYALNGIGGVVFPRRAKPEAQSFTLGGVPGGGRLRWDGKRQRWTGLRAAIVEFVPNRHAGTRHKLGVCDCAGGVRYYPVIQINRTECIGAAVEELLTPEEGVNAIAADGTLREAPALALPVDGYPGCPEIVGTLDAHLLAGSQKKIDPDTGEETDAFVDKVENHLLLCAGYAGVAEGIGAETGRGVTYRAVLID